MNHLGEKCHEIANFPETCPIGESMPEINYWVKGDGCCEIDESEDELCELKDYKKKTTKKKTTTKASTKPTTKPKTKPSSNDVDSGLLEVFAIE